MCLCGLDVVGLGAFGLDGVGMGGVGMSGVGMGGFGLDGVGMGGVGVGWAGLGGVGLICPGVFGLFGPFCICCISPPRCPPLCLECSGGTLGQPGPFHHAPASPDQVGAFAHTSQPHMLYIL